MGQVAIVALAVASYMLVFVGAAALIWFGVRKHVEQSMPQPASATKTKLVAPGTPSLSDDGV